MSNFRLFTDGDSNQRAFEEFIVPHFDALYRRAWHLTGNNEDAEDLVQELCIRIFPRFHQAESVDNAKAWLMRVLYNLFIDFTRKNARTPLHVVTADDDEDSTVTLACLEPMPEENVDSILTQRRLRRALRFLRPEERALLVLHEIEDYSLSELAALTELPESTVKSRLHRARIKLGRLMSANDSETDIGSGGTSDGLSEIRHSVG